MRTLSLVPSPSSSSSSSSASIVTSSIRALRLAIPFPSSPYCNLSRKRQGKGEASARMAENDGEDDGVASMSKLATHVDRIKQLVHGQSTGQLGKVVFKRRPMRYLETLVDIVSLVQRPPFEEPKSGWEKCWEQRLTPWDLGGPTPIIQQLHQIGALPKGRALIPGCGAGYDVVSIACPERYVVGIDISEIALKGAIELFSSSPNANHFTFLKEDFFTWHPTELFDLIFDYTFFCAIEPKMRVAWAERMSGLLGPEGELITLMFPISDHIGGPPYKVSISDYEEVLCPLGFKAISIMDNELAVGPRKGKEKIGRWKKIGNDSSL